MGEIVYLSLGSNQGNRELNLARATRSLSIMEGLTVLEESSLYHSPPLDCPDDCPDFLNKIIKADCVLDPLPLLDNTERLELQLGRTEKNTRADRPIDIDIILFGSRLVRNERLEIPHPRTAERSFVLIPLCEIDPDIVDPRTNQPFSDLLPILGDQGVRIIKEVTVE